MTMLKQQWHQQWHQQWLHHQRYQRWQWSPGGKKVGIGCSSIVLKIAIDIFRWTKFLLSLQRWWAKWWPVGAVSSQWHLFLSKPHILKHSFIKISFFAGPKNREHRAWQAAARCKVSSIILWFSIHPQGYHISLQWMSHMITLHWCPKDMQKIELVRTNAGKTNNGGHVSHLSASQGNQSIKYLFWACFTQICYPRPEESGSGTQDAIGACVGLLQNIQERRTRRAENCQDVVHHFSMAIAGRLRSLDERSQLQAMHEIENVVFSAQMQAIYRQEAESWTRNE